MFGIGAYKPCPKSFTFNNYNIYSLLKRAEFNGEEKHAANYSLNKNTSLQRHTKTHKVRLQ